MDQDWYAMYMQCVAVQPMVHVIQPVPYIPSQANVVQRQPTMCDFMEDCAMVKTDSPFRSTFTTYLESQVPNAAYLEGMRVAILEQNVDKAVSIMSPMKKKSPHAALAIPILKVCIGDYYLALNEMYYFWQRNKDFKVANSYGTDIIKHVAQLAPFSTGYFTQSWVYLYVPPRAAAGHRCKNCLLYSYAKIYGTWYGLVIRTTSCICLGRIFLNFYWGNFSFTNATYLFLNFNGHTSLFIKQCCTMDMKCCNDDI